MSKPDLWRPSLAAWAITSLLVILLAACGGATTTPAAEEEPAAASPTEAQVEEETEAEAVAQNTPTTEMAEPTTAPAAEEQAAEAAPQQASGPATCAPLEIPDSLIPPVSDEDWAKGPATAAMTVLELGDFQ